MSTQQVNMLGSSSGSSTVTLDSIKEHHKTIVLRLRAKTENVMKTQEVKNGYIKSTYKFLIKNCKSLKFWSNESPEKITEKNLKQVDGIFDEMAKLLQQEKDNAKEQMIGKSDEEQKQILELYRMFAEFFNDLISVFGEMMANVAEGIKAGLVIDSKLLKQFFQEILDEVQRILNLNTPPEALQGSPEAQNALPEASVTPPSSTGSSSSSFQTMKL